MSTNDLLPEDDFQLPTSSSVHRTNWLTHSYEGIEEIRKEMPSQTLGRRRGEYLERMLSDEAFFEQTMANPTIRNRKKSSAKVEQLVAHDNTMLAVEDFERVKDGKLRDLPFTMEFKKKLRKTPAYQKDNNKENTKKKLKKKSGTQRSKIYSLWNDDLLKIEGNFGSGVASYFLFLRGMFFLSLPSFLMSFCFISVPQLIQPPPRVDPNITFTGEELLTGSHWLSDTIMYYGHYVNGTISTDLGLHAYDMQLAYLLTTFFYFLVCLVWLIRETAITLKDSFVDSLLDARSFSTKTFCSWNYNIRSEDNAQLQHKSIYFDLKEVLAEKKRLSSEREVKGKWKIYAIRVLVWFCWSAITAASIAFVYFLNEKLLNQLKTNERILNDMLLSLFVSTVNLLMPYIITFMTHLEKYENPRAEIFVAVIRTFILKIGMLGTICVYWTLDITDSETSLGACWETRLGEEVYRLIVVDFIFSILFSTFCMEFLRKIFSDLFGVGSRANFSIAINVLDLIYGQTLCWVGIYFSPILSLIVIIKYVLLFYIKKTSVLGNCVPSKRRWRASQSRTFFNSLLFFCFIASFAFIVYVFYKVKPSDDCGPFRGLNNSYEVITNSFIDINANDNEWFTNLMSVIFSIWFIYGVAIAILVHLIFRRSRVRAKKEFIDRLKEQIVMQGLDKKLLLRWLRSAVDDNNKPNKPFGKVHRDPLLASPGTSASVVNSSMVGSDGDVLMTSHLTHVDPQHAAYNAGVSGGGRPRHTEPLLTKAFENRVRPVSTYNVPEAFTEMRPYSKSVSQAPRHPEQRFEMKNLSPLERALASKEANRANASNMEEEEDWAAYNP